ncbi:MAG: pilus assembly protein, partial [Pseudomonadota bacterium]
HNGTDYSQSDAWTAELCNSIKKTGVSIYTLSFGTTVSSETKKLLKRCATSPAYFFDAADRGKLVAAFDDIAGSLMKLYLKK